MPIYVAASGPLAAKLAGRVGDGFICTSGKDPQLYVDLLDNVKEGAEKAGRDYESIKRMIEVKVSYDRDLEVAEKASHWWAALALTPEEKEGVEDPVEMERLADNALDRAHTRFIVSDDPQEIADKIQPYIDLGFSELVFHFPGNDQRRYIDEFAADVLPLLRNEHFEILDERFKPLRQDDRAARPPLRRLPLGGGSRVLPRAPRAGLVGHPERPHAALRRGDRATSACSARPRGYTNGHTVDAQGRLVSCEHGNRRVTRTEHDGTITVLADAYEGKRLNCPNDVVVRSDGTVYFTDPAYGIEG